MVVDMVHAVEEQMKRRIDEMEVMVSQKEKQVGGLE